MHIVEKYDHYMVTLSIEEDTKKDNPIDKKAVEEAEEIVNYFKSELKTMEEELPLDTWDKYVELCVILKIYLTYGMLRPSEIIDMQTTDTYEGFEKMNYINVQSKQIVINNTRTTKKDVR